jgi:hypothetical protein
MPLVKKRALIQTPEFIEGLQPVGDKPIDLRVTVGVNHTTLEWYEHGEIEMPKAGEPPPPPPPPAPPEDDKPKRGRPKKDEDKNE